MKKILLLLFFTTSAYSANYEIYSHSENGADSRKILAGKNDIVRVLVKENHVPAITQKDVEKALEKVLAEHREQFKKSFKPSPAKIDYSFTVVLNNKATRAFAEYSRKNIGRRTTFMVNGKQVAEPLIQSIISVGVISFTGDFTKENVENWFPKSEGNIFYEIIGSGS